MEVEGDKDEVEDMEHRGLSASLDLQRSLATLASHARFSVWGLSTPIPAGGVAAATATGLCSRARISRFLGGKHPLLLSWFDFIVVVYYNIPRQCFFKALLVVSHTSFPLVDGYLERLAFSRCCVVLFSLSVH